MRNVNQILEYCKKATPPPWEANPVDDLLYEVITDQYGNDLLCSENRENDAVFIVNAREDLPRAIEIVRLLRRAIQSIDLEPLPTNARWQLERALRMSKRLIE